MKRFYLSFFLVISALTICRLSAQVTFIVDSLPDYTPPQDNLYIAGDMTGWDPGNPAYVMQRNTEDKWSVTLESEPEGTLINFKFTRGSWETVEKGAQGEELPNRQFTYGNGDTINVVILNWRDAGGGGGGTAAENVIIMDDNFYMPQLNRNRRIWIYLPPDYESSQKSYPVLYMHDGQNLFDQQTSYAGEWEVDETLNHLADLGSNVPIVVGIDNGGTTRIDEYAPWHNQQYGGGDGELYIEFIIETLKPYIDNNYRTIPGRDCTGIMGSSLGGLISHYGALKYQDIFSKAGIFSPAYWFSDSVWAFTHQAGRQEHMKFYQMCGTLEGSSTVPDMLSMQDSLLALGFTQDEVYSKVVPGGQHNEILWRQEFEQAYLWLFGSYTNSIVDLQQPYSIIIFPNPVSDVLNISGVMPSSSDSLEVFDMSGIRVLSVLPFKGKEINVSGLIPGLYLVNCSANGKIYQGKFIKN